MPAAVKESASALAPIPGPGPNAAYVHIPFCVHRCHYCDFAVVAGRDDAAERYLDALEAEIAFRLASFPPAALLASLFLGGGTPTQLTAAQLDRLFGFLRRLLPWAPAAEVSIEANPDGLTEDKIRVLQAHGVDRISLGVQSFLAERLRFLEREHTPKEALAVVEKLLPRFRSVSVDLIFGTPGQSTAEWRKELETAAALGVQHLSTYGLTYEKGTRLWKAKERGAVLPLAEEHEADLYGEAMDRLEAAGFEHYELSNFAKPGHRCRHNEAYWANHAYHGFGLGAARYLSGVRSVNTRSFEGYLRKCLFNADPTQSHEELSPEDRARETAMLNLRRAEGIIRQEFSALTGFRIDDLASEAIRRNLVRGWLVDHGDRIALARTGKFMADTVMSEFLMTSH